MNLTEFTFSDSLHDALMAAFARLADRRIDGVPLAQWLSRQNIEEDSFLLPDIHLALASTLENVLALNGGKEGLALLEALDGIVHGGGAPALLIHGVPSDQDVGPLVREALRLCMYSDPNYRFGTQLRLKDTPLPASEPGYKAKGFLHWHHDDADIGLLFGINAGDNPRHTELMSLPDFIERVSALTTTYGHTVSPKNVAELLCAPIWPLVATPPHSREGVSLTFDRQRLATATRFGLQRIGADGKKYGPMLFANRAYDPREEGSQPFELLESPFAHFKARLMPDRTALSPELAVDVKPCIMAMERIMGSIVKSKTGPVLKAGDALVFNNRRLLHAGGPYVHDRLAKANSVLSYENPRHIVSLDGKIPAEEYSVRPGDRVAQPIHMGSVRQVAIDPATFERQ